MNLVESVESSLESVDSPSVSFIFPDYPMEQTSDFARWDDVATPTNGTPLSRMKASCLCSPIYPDALRCECHLCEKLLESVTSPIEPDTP
jgi:hypothetical protein